MSRKSFIEEAIKRAASQAEDNYRRAKLQFEDCTPEQMENLYGQSGKTRQDVFDENLEEYNDSQAALDWLYRMRTQEGM